MGHLHLKAYPRSPFREEGGNPHRQEILVKCSDKKGGGRDLENLGESLGKSDGLDELDKSDKLDKSDESDGGSVVLRKRASLRGEQELQACASGERHELQARASSGFEKLILLVMIGLITENRKSTVELFYKK